MLLNFEDFVAERNIKVGGVLHCGAHLAEEAPVYARLGCDPVVWVEANPHVMPKLREALKAYPDQHLIQACVTDKDDDTVTFHVTNYDGMSSSIFPWGTHTEFSPDTVHIDEVTLTTKTIDTLGAFHPQSNFFQGIDTLVMDLEGAELLALKGATHLMRQIDTLYLEVRTAEVYVGAPMVWELDGYLTDFERVATHMVGDQGWGDAVWLRTKIDGVPR